MGFAGREEPEIGFGPSTKLQDQEPTDETPKWKK